MTTDTDIKANPFCATHIQMVKDIESNTKLVMEFKNELAKFKNDIWQMKYLLIIVALEGGIKLLGWN